MANAKHPDQPQAADAFAFADVRVDAAAHRLTRAGREIGIEPKAFAVLLQFLAQPGVLLDRDTLLDAVWGHSHVTPGTVNRLIAQLRRALGDDSRKPRFIQTVHGLGYRFIAPLIERAPEAPLPSRFTPPARARLPQRAGPLLGRDTDIEQLSRSVRKHRLVTVAGTGGIGKTCLALETARRLEADFPDGVWMLDCTPHPHREDLLRWLATLFDLPVRTADPSDVSARIGGLLKDRRSLLVFDNCERIAEALGPIIANLLDACAQVHVIATSQRRLNCRHESLYRLAPLPVPSDSDWSAPAELARLSRIPSAQLLLMRLGNLDSRFALTPDNAPKVAQICRRLDGLPLALEIAAAHLRLLSPAQLLAHMDRHLLKLAEARPGEPAHHQTLNALIGWSYRLLSEPEQALLCGLGVYAGSFSIDAALAVGKAVGLDDTQLLERMRGLLDTSLLSVDASADPRRYRLLDSVRLFALERLAESGAEQKVREAHLGYCMQLARQLDLEFRQARQRYWTECIKREWANIKTAFAFALSTRAHAGDALEMLGNLCWYFRVSADYGESASLLERALAVSASSTPSRARALIALGLVLHHSQIHARSGPRLREGIALAMQLEQTWLAAAGEAVLAFDLATCGDPEAAETLVASALATAEDQNDAWLRSLALLARGVALALQRRHDDAERCLDQAFTTLPEAGTLQFQHAYTLFNRGLQRFYLNRLPEAAQDWLRGMNASIEMQNWRGVAGCVEGAAYLAAEHGDAGQAASLLAAAARERSLTDAPLMPQWQDAHAATEDRLRGQLGPSFETYQHEGASARFESLAAQAREVLVRTAGAQPSRSGRNRPSGS